MSEDSRFPGQAEAGDSKEKVRKIKEEFKMPHPHALTPFQKLITVVELVFVFIVVALIFKTVLNHSSIMLTWW